MKIPKLCVLVSYAYMNENLTLLAEGWSEHAVALIDSGAYTNYQRLIRGKGAVVTLKGYIAACKRLHGKVWRYITLDDPDRPVETDANWTAMRKEGLTPMPVLVHGHPFEKVNELIECDPDHRVCVAGGVKTKDRYAFHRCQRAYTVSGERAKIHALGFVRWPEMFQLPIATVDSSSWCNGGSWGTVTLYSRTSGFATCQVTKLGSQRGRAARAHLARCGVSVEVVNNREHHRRVCGYPGLTTINAYLELAHHGALQSPSYFFAIPNLAWATGIACVLKHKRGEFYDYPAARAQFEDWARRRIAGENREVIAETVGVLAASTQHDAVGPNERASRIVGVTP